MRFATVLMTGALSLAAAAGATDLRDNVGYLDFQAMGFFNEDDLSVNVNLDGSLLKLISAIGADDDQDAAELLAKLDAVQVRVLPLSDDARSADVLQKVSALSRQLGEAGWDRIIRVKERDQRVEIYLQHRDAVVSGLAVMAVEPDDEAVFINLVGEIDLKRIGAIGRKFHFGKDTTIDLDSLSDIDKEMERLKNLRDKRAEANDD